MVEEILTAHEQEFFINIVPNNLDLSNITSNQLGFFVLDSIMKPSKHETLEDIWTTILLNYSLQIYSVIERNLMAKGSLKNSLSRFDKIGISITYNLMEIINQYSINQIVFFDTPHHPVSIIANYIAKELCIEVITSKGMPMHHGSSRLRRRYVTNNFPYFDKKTQQLLGYDYLSEDNNLYTKLPDDLIDYLANYQAVEKISYNKKKHLGTRWTLNYIIGYLFKATSEHLKNNQFSDLFSKAGHYIKFFITESIIRKKILSKYSRFMVEEIDLGIPYIYFPFQYQPEATTTPLGVPYRDHLEILRMISESSPEKYKIYVREHPAYWHRRSSRESIRISRSKKFYETISSLSNVVIISPNSNHVDLIKNSSLIVSITGTVLWESFFYNKRALMFGQYIYKDLPNVIAYHDNSSIKYALENVESIISGENHKSLTGNVLKIIENITYVSNLDSSRKNPVNLYVELMFILNYSSNIRVFNN